LNADIDETNAEYNVRMNREQKARTLRDKKKGKHRVNKPKAVAPQWTPEEIERYEAAKVFRERLRAGLRNFGK